MAVPLSDEADLYLKGEISKETPEDQRRLTDQQLAWLDRMQAEGVVGSHFNTALFTNGDSTQPELAGVLGAVVGSALMLMVTALIAIPLGVGAAVWLEEFAPKNKLTDIIEVNINNLAAVPSIVYGLLGLALFINWMHLPRASPIVGGLVLALMALPTLVIATRSALKAVPPSIREAALAMGAQDPDGVQPRPASGHARRDDRRNHLHGARPGRDCAAAPDRHGQLRSRRAACDRPAGRRPAFADLHLGERLRAGVPRTHRCCDHRSSGLHDHHEHGGHHPEAALRASVVRE